MYKERFLPLFIKLWRFFTLALYQLNLNRQLFLVILASFGQTKLSCLLFQLLVLFLDQDHLSVYLGTLLVTMYLFPCLHLLIFPLLLSDISLDQFKLGNHLIRYISFRKTFNLLFIVLLQFFSLLHQAFVYNFKLF